MVQLGLIPPPDPAPEPTPKPAAVSARASRRRWPLLTAVCATVVVLLAAGSKLVEWDAISTKGPIRNARQASWVGETASIRRQATTVQLEEAMATIGNLKSLAVASDAGGAEQANEALRHIRDGASWSSKEDPINDRVLDLIDDQLADLIRRLQLIAKGDDADLARRALQILRTLGR